MNKLVGESHATLAAVDEAVSVDALQSLWQWALTHAPIANLAHVRLQHVQIAVVLNARVVLCICLGHHQHLQH